MRKYILVVFLLVFALGSCVTPGKLEKQVSINELAGVDASGYPNVKLIFDVENNMMQNIRLRNGEITVNNGQKTIVKIKADDITISKCTSGTVDVPLRINVNRTALLTSVGRLVKNPDEITVSGEVKIKSGLLGKKFTFTDVPLPDFLNKLDMDQEALLKLIK